MCEKTSVKIVGRTAILKSERGFKAIVGADTLCILAKRLNLCLENYKC
ncbi:MAG: hypothetical protein N3D82_04120 [Ignisphaera sp.]|nr:hypothetical protein [Ignisphaera sp.]MCX8168194.1 hypothetical protein [Ignisphaera sp.]